MDLDDLLTNVLDEFLLECVCDKIEDVSELPKMLKDIGYLDNKQELIQKTTICEILDGEDAFVENYEVAENEVHIQYTIRFILQTFIDSEFIWSVQGCAQAELSIPEAVLNDINDIMEDDDFDEQIEKYEDILEESVSFQNTVYTEVECDTLYLLDKSKSPDDI